MANIILILIIAAALAIAVSRQFRRHRHASCCDDCDEQGCALRGIMETRAKKQKETHAHAGKK